MSESSSDWLNLIFRFQGRFDFIHAESLFNCTSSFCVAEFRVGKCSSESPNAAVTASVSLS